MLALLAVLALALVLRLAPLLFYPVWGSDTGEYAHITRHIAEHGVPPADYAGWGFAYPLFPGMEYLAGAVARATGLDALLVLQVLVPALNVLAVYAVYRLARRLVAGERGAVRHGSPDGAEEGGAWGRGDAPVPSGADAGTAHRAGILSAAVAAVAMPLVFTGSHPMPESLGHALALLVLWLALDADRDRGRLARALALGLAVVVTHHLSTYMMLLGLAGLWLGRLLTRRDDPAWGRLGLLVALGLAALAYWTFAAVPFRERIIARALPVVWIWAGALAGAAGLVLLARSRHRVRWTVEMAPGEVDRAPLLGAALIAVVLAAVALFVTVGGPGVSFRLDAGIVPWSLPLILLLGFVPLGTAHLRAAAEGAAIYAWMGLLGLSLLVGWALLPTVLIPYRHLPYLMVPASILAGRGLAAALPAGPLRGTGRGTENGAERGTGHALDDVRGAGRGGRTGGAGGRRAAGGRGGAAWRGGGSGEAGGGGRRWRDGLRLAGVLLLLLALGATAYPPQHALAGFQEGITDAEMDAVRWAGANRPEGATFLADHRLSSVLFGLAGMTPSWDSGQAAWYAPSFDEARSDLANLSTSRGTFRVDHVLISPVTERGVALVQWERADPLTGEARAKFDRPPFEVLYEREGVHIYRIAWEDVR